MPDGEGGERHRRCLTEDPLPKRERPKIRYLYEDEESDGEDER